MARPLIPDAAGVNLKIGELRYLARPLRLPSLEDKTTYVAVDVAGGGWRSHSIAVPARAYSHEFSSSEAKFSSSLCKSLNGLRVAVKDNFHIKGTRTSLCDRAFFQTYPPQYSSAEVVSRLEENGSHIVGKTYMSAFAMMEHPTQSVDYQASFNPRGDGYLITGGSSGGSAAAIASYNWIDIAICSDTTGSARIPAFQTGVFGFRPSTNIISSKGLEKAWAAVDVPAWFARDLTIFPQVLDALKLYDHQSSGGEQRQIEILYIEDFIPEGNIGQQDAVTDFLRSIESAVKAPIRRINIHNAWRNSAPVDEKDLRQFLYETTSHGWFYSAYHSFDKFRKDYGYLHGRSPFVTEVIKWYWELGQKITPEEHQEVMDRFSIFRAWFSETYFSDNTKTTVFFNHIDKIQPRYRDQYPGNNNPVVPGLRATYLASILKAPELAVPIGQIPYHSRITNQIEQIPLVISLMGAPCTDLELIKWAIDVLQKAKRPTKVKTGKTAF
ncbi:hypothetical protein H2198_000519 [Neophaeococcomyces mojaviensis]|uniref:Uncharacterized protein n=1 Tax=Neophaeococcomyces mojaviensis TaxID=3383035 RepID=A0ACC3AJK8_9EURO|nr:hypothetical protein H2198_000519 [Knufia sp. JES_112]